MMVTVLCGGFGAARFLEGFRGVGHQLCCIVNTGDDLDYLGLHVCPDVDSVLYALAGCFDEQRGWGPVDDTFAAHEALARYGDAWFCLGDRDLALSLQRTSLLRNGCSLSQATEALASSWDVDARLLPITDQPVPTLVETSAGRLGLQDFLVRHRGRPEVRGVIYEDVNQAEVAPGVTEAIADAHVLVLAPSNPISSIGAILAVPGVRSLIAHRRCPTVAVSPVVLGVEPTTEPERGRFAVRAKFMGAAGVAHRASAVAAQFRGLVDGFVVDSRDHDAERCELSDLELPVLWTDLIPAPGPARISLVEQVLRFAAALPIARRLSA